jgi:hypothetical protein
MVPLGGNTSASSDCTRAEVNRFVPLVSTRTRRRRRNKGENRDGEHAPGDCAQAEAAVADNHAQTVGTIGQLFSKTSSMAKRLMSP